MLQEKSIKINFSNTQRLGFLSVIIPVYKDVAGLRLTIDALKKQTCSKRYIEILVANDGDRAEIDQYCLSQKIMCISISPKTGSYNARNRALKYARGEFIAFIDAGSMAAKNWAEEGILNLKNYDYVGGSVEVVSQDINSINPLLVFERNREFAVSEFMNELHFAPTTNLFIKRSIIEKLGGFDSRLNSSGDLEFGDRVFKSQTFSQYYDKELKVYHPARNYREFIRKQMRLAKGLLDLGRFYKARFPQYRLNILISLLKIVAPPIWLFRKSSWLALSLGKRLTVFLLTYHFSFIQHAFFILYGLLHAR